MVMGDFDDSSNGTLSWIVFLLATMLNLIIMLNLLIAIVSETFTNVLERKIENSYREKAAIIVENYFLLRNDLKDQNEKTFDSLIIIKPLTGKLVDYNSANFEYDEDDENVVQGARSGGGGGGGTL